MSILQLTETEINLSKAYNSNAKLIINKAFDNYDITLWLKEYILPEISKDPVNVPLSEYDVNVEGNRLTYGDFTSQVMVDEDFKTYDDLYNWVVNTNEGDEITAYLLILNNQRTAVVKRFLFENVLLTSLGALNFNNYGSENLAVDITLSIDRFLPT
jgi:hypothetical protein